MRAFLIFSSVLMLVSSGVREAAAQAPHRFNYQGIARGSGGAALVSQAIGLRISIVNGSATGPAVYMERHQTTTNAYGLYNLAIGGGTPLSGTIESINWGSGDKYIRVEIDPAGGTSYTNLGTTQLLSVPYALYSLSGAPGPQGPAGPQGPQGPQGPPGSGSLSGTQNYVVKFTGATTAGNSQIFDNGTNVGIGTTTPGARLHISGSQDGSMTIPPFTAPFEHQAFAAHTAATPTSRVTNAIIGSAANSIIENHGVFGASIGTADTSVNIGGFFTGQNAVTNRINIGVYAASAGVNNAANYRNYGVYAVTDPSVGYAGYFAGDLGVTGFIYKGGGTFKIDHPLDPENKYLYHSFVESPDMMNVYNGNVVTNAQGEAVVTLPDYFPTLNKDFRYQLTVIDAHQFAQARVSRKISGNQFTITTDKPYIEVSWQVTGIRQDKFAVANPVIPEVEKEPANKGYYLHAKEWGQPETKSIHYQIMPPSARQLTAAGNITTATPVQQPVEKQEAATEKQGE